MGVDVVQSVDRYVGADLLEAQASWLGDVDFAVCAHGLRHPQGMRGEVAAKLENGLAFLDEAAQQGGLMLGPFAVAFEGA